MRFDVTTAPLYRYVWVRTPHPVVAMHDGARPYAVVRYTFQDGRRTDITVVARSATLQRTKRIARDRQRMADASLNTRA